jgi:hypothetical protein
MGASVLILGDGAHEVGDRPGELLSSEELPSLALLVHRILGEPAEVQYESRMFKKIVHQRGKGSDEQKKMKAAIIFAKQKGYKGLVIVQDRDRKTQRQAIAPLEEVRDTFSLASAVNIALGLAIETFDAWMIADPDAIEKAGGDKNHHHANPEALDKKEGTGQHPKDIAALIFDSGKRLDKEYQKIARFIDLGLLKNRCQKGFESFANDVRTNLATLCSES